MSGERWVAFPGKAPVCRACGADWVPVRRGECSRCGDDAGPTPTPEPSEVAETTSGERKGCHVGYPYCDGRRPCACPCHDPAEPDAGEVLDEVAALSLAEEIWQDEPTEAEQLLMQRVLTSDWLAAHVSAAETKARADERERIAVDALDCVREWTQMDGRLVLHGRDLTDFRDQLADVIAGRAS